MSFHHVLTDEQIETAFQAPRQKRDRPAANPGGMECEECGGIFIGEEWHSRCKICDDNYAALSSDHRGS